jgi:insulysin
MKLFLRILPLFIVLIGVHGAFAADLPERHPLDNSESRTLVLDNGLRVLLVSDPDLNLAAASMAVGVGSLMDPEEVQGLAHFLEHMLFLGTEKYPDEGEYTEYLARNGGYSNAYTSSDHTNYHFQLFPEAFEGALDRFSQFFIAPLFTEEFAEREVNAVDSEFKMYLEDDGWRGFRMLGIHARPDHPENSFNIGNRESLAGATREQLIAFYQEHYSANQMALAMVAPDSLDQLEAWARHYFAAVPNHGIEAHRYPTQFIERDGRLKLIKMKAIEDRRRLNVYFNTPGIRRDWDAKSSQLIGALLGYEGAGSLLSSLKEENLATDLGAGFWDRTMDYTSLSVGIDLTAEGLEKIDRVLEKLMGYIEMLRTSPYPDYFWEEQATMARLQDIYTDKGEGAQRAVALANRALTLPLEAAEKAPTIFARQDPDFYYAVLDQLRPDNMLAILSARDFTTDRVEDIFGIEYAHLEITGDRMERLLQPDIKAAFSLPKPNPFVPESVKLLAETPVRLIDEPGLTLYYGQDREFQRPKVAMQFRIRPADRAYSARDAVLIELFEASINEYVNELAYDARMADLSYSVSAGLEGVSVALFGYTESAEKLLPHLVGALRGFDISDARFNAIKDRLVRQWNNARLDNAYAYARHFTNKASYRDYFTPEEKSAASEGLTLDDVKELRDDWLGEGGIESLIYGNTTATASIEAARNLQRQLGIRAPADGRPLYENKLLEMPPATTAVFKDVLPTNNSVFRKDYTVGLATPETRVAAAVLQNLIQAPYYSEMRTRQQLGYVVWSFTFEREDEVKLGFVIQSGDYDPLELVARSDDLIGKLPQLLRDMPAEAFAQAKAAVRSELEIKPKTIAEKAGRFFRMAYDHDGNWDRIQESLDALDGLGVNDIIALMEAVNDPQQHRYQLVLLFARQAAELAEQSDGLSDIAAWKRAQSFRRITRI